MSDTTETALYHKQRGTAGLGLFDSAVARDADPVTSHKGHDKVTKSGTRKSHAQVALECYRAYGELTDAEVERITGIKGIWKRCSDLRNADPPLTIPTGEERDGQRVCKLAS